MEAVREARHDLANANDLLTPAMKIAQRVFQLAEAANHSHARGHDLLTPAMKIAQRVFQLADALPLRRLEELADQWCKKPKPLVGQGTLREFLEYVELLREAGGCLAEDGGEDDPVAALAPTDFSSRPLEDAVQLMTVHAAKEIG